MAPDPAPLQEIRLPDTLTDAEKAAVHMPRWLALLSLTSPFATVATFGVCFKLTLQHIDLDNDKRRAAGDEGMLHTTQHDLTIQVRHPPLRARTLVAIGCCHRHRPCRPAILRHTRRHRVLPPPCYASQVIALPMVYGLMSLMSVVRMWMLGTGSAARRADHLDWKQISSQTVQVCSSSVPRLFLDCSSTVPRPCCL